MTGTALVQEIVSILVSGLTGVASGIGTGISEMVSGLIYVVDDGVTSLSPFAIVVIAFAGISLALGLMRLIYQFFTSLGARNR